MGGEGEGRVSGEERCRCQGPLTITSGFAVVWLRTDFAEVSSFLLIDSRPATLTPVGAPQKGPGEDPACDSEVRPSRGRSFREGEEGSKCGSVFMLPEEWPECPGSAAALGGSAQRRTTEGGCPGLLLGCCASATECTVRAPSSRIELYGTQEEFSGVLGCSRGSRSRTTCPAPARPLFGLGPQESAARYTLGPCALGHWWP